MSGFTYPPIPNNTDCLLLIHLDIYCWSRHIRLLLTQGKIKSCCFKNPCLLYLCVRKITQVQKNSGQSRYFVYILFLITSTFWMLNEGGYLFEYLWPNFPSLHNKMRTILSSLSILSFLGLIISHHKENFKKNSKSPAILNFSSYKNLL